MVFSPLGRLAQTDSFTQPGKLLSKRRILDHELCKTPKIERSDMLRFDSGAICSGSLVIIWRCWFSSPSPKKRKGALWCGQAIGITDLPDLRPPAFVRGGLLAAQPVQKAVIAQRLQRPHNRVT